MATRDFEVLSPSVIRLYSHLDRPGEVTRALVGAGVGLSAVEPQGANLEDYFLGLIGGVRHA